MPPNIEGIERFRQGLDVWIVTDLDIAGPILTIVGQIHRKQMEQVFASEGAVSAQGRWAPLNPGYAEWKRRFLGTPGTILTLSGEMRARFTQKSRQAAGQYIQRYVKPYIELGASSTLAVRHFLGIAPLPRRDMSSKSDSQIREMRQGIAQWWDEDRFPQIQRAINILKGRRH